MDEYARWQFDGEEASHPQWPSRQVMEGTRSVTDRYDRQCNQWRAIGSEMPHALARGLAVRT